MKAADRLDQLCETIPPLLTQIAEPAFSAKPAPDKWSKKEIIGHLIDSATNNHHRMVRAQFEDQPTITYNQDNWNKHNYYQQMDGADVISFWTSYNKHLASVIRKIPSAHLAKKVQTGESDDKNIMTLQFVIDDYVEHLEYHLRQVVKYK